MIRLLSAIIFVVEAPWTLLRAIFAASDKLSAEDAASTLYRFFRSKHVVDLELIMILAVVVLVCHLILAIEFPPALPLAQLGHRLGTYFAPAIPIYAAVIAWAYLTAGTRLGVVDLFACEMRTVCRVGTAFDIGVIYVDRYQQCVKKKNDENSNAPLEQHPPSATSKGFVSEENYFPVFENNAHDLEALEATVVGHITEFYTYMKVTRDLLRQVENQTASSAQSISANLIYVVFLGYESARKAIKELIEFEPTRAENMMMILLTELVCYKFLCEYYRKDDPRFERLALRLHDYEDDLDYIERKVKPHDASDKDWGPAKRTLQELTNRYDAVRQTLQLLIAQRTKSPLQDNKTAEPVPTDVAA